MSTSPKTEVLVVRKPRKSTNRLSIAEVFAFVWLGVLVAGAVLVGVLPIPDPDVPDYAAYLAGPSASHWLGTDELGRDILSRTLHGARVSLSLAIATVGLGVTLGTILGMIAGFFRGIWDTIIGVGVDMILAFPVLILILVIVAIRGPSYEGLILGLTVGTLPAFIRMARAHTMVWANREFVMAARGLGARNFRLIFKSVLPMVAPPLLVYSLIVAALVMMAEGSLSFLGYGVPLPAASWGGMIASGRQVMQLAPHVVAVPALTLTLSVMALNVLGDRLERRGNSNEK